MMRNDAQDEHCEITLIYKQMIHENLLTCVVRFLIGLFRVSSLFHVVVTSLIERDHVDRLLVIVVVVVVGFRGGRAMIVVRAITRFIALYSPVSADAVTRHRVSCDK